MCVQSILETSLTLFEQLFLITSCSSEQGQEADIDTQCFSFVLNSWQFLRKKVIFTSSALERNVFFFCFSSPLRTLLSTIVS